MIFKSHYKHYKNYKPYDNFYIITIKCIICGFLGLILGIIINDTVIYISNKLKIKNKVIQTIIQIVLCAMIVSFLNTSNNLVGWTLHNTIPGIFFITLLFNDQLKLVYSINRINIIKNEDDERVKE